MFVYIVYHICGITVLVLTSFTFVAYTIFSLIFRAIKSAVGISPNDEQNITAKKDLEDHQKLIREKRLKWLKEQSLQKMENAERDLAKYLNEAGEEVVKESLQDLVNEGKENMETINENENDNQDDNDDDENRDDDSDNSENRDDIDDENQDTTSKNKTINVKQQNIKSNRQTDNQATVTSKKSRRRRRRKNKKSNSGNTDGYAAENDD